MTEQPFWKRKTLAEMTGEEWESLCDGCAKCCLLKLEDEDTGEIAHTDIACQLLDLDICRCTNYPARARRIADCVVLSPKNVGDLGWMPSSCAYRLISEGRDLPAWHHLVSGDRETVHLAGHSVRGRVVPEDRGDDPEDRIVEWPA